MPKKANIPLIPAIKDFIADHLLDDQPRRLHISKDLIERFISKRQRVEMKPIGIWYGFNESWLEWMLDAGCNWFQPYIYEVIVDEEKLLRISNHDQFEDFEEEFGSLPAYMLRMQENARKVKAAGFDTPDYDYLFGPNPLGMRRYTQHIDFPKLSKQYSALEITPYLYGKRLEAIWYYGWDCASGCVWNKKGLKELRLFAQYDPEQKQYVLK